MDIEEFEYIESLKDTFESFASNVKDPRMERTKLHPVKEVLFVAFIGVLSGCEGWLSLEDFGKDKLGTLRKFYPFKNGTPSDDTLRRFFRRVSPNGLRAFLLGWVKSIDLPDDKLVSIDGKVSRSSIRESGRQLNTVSAYASEEQIVLGQLKCSDKSNEITAIPKLLELIDIKGAIITIDAAGTQTQICDSILSKSADYVIGLKANQEALLNAVVELFKKVDMKKNEGTIASIVTHDQGHGRNEERLYEVLDASMCEQLKATEWPGLKSVVRVTSKRLQKGKESISVRYYISSLNPLAELLSRAIRSHWAIENSLHWILDFVFRDDASKIRKGNAPENMMIIKQLCLNLLKRAQLRRQSIKSLRASCGRNDDTLMRVLRQIASL